MQGECVVNVTVQTGDDRIGHDIGRTCGRIGIVGIATIAERMSVGGLRSRSQNIFTGRNNFRLEATRLQGAERTERRYFAVPQSTGDNRDDILGGRRGSHDNVTEPTILTIGPVSVSAGKDVEQLLVDGQVTGGQLVQ